MTSKEIRNSFLNFFEKRGHGIALHERKHVLKGTL